jgi:predicted porin
MNKNIKLAVAGAVLALSATAANAGIIIPAGEWTLDVNGNVNSFVNYTHADAQTGGAFLTSGEGSTFTSGASAAIAASPSTGKYGNKYVGINTGLLPAWLGFTGTTRQNDIDVSFTISLQPNVSDNTAAGDNKAPLFRQTFLTFGDKSWGSIKLGKDIGIFASDAILNDMTLLSVGGGAVGANGASGNATSLGGIGTGYIYAAWKGQAAYSTPNFNGFQATIGITNPDQINNSTVSVHNQDRYGLEGKASYSFSQNDMTGKVWVSGASYDAQTSGTLNHTVSVADIGANVNAMGFGLTGYYYSGKGAGTTLLGAYSVSADNARRDSDGGYIQLTYVTPVKTKIGVAYGISNLDTAGNDSTTNNSVLKSNERVTVGAYHPLTKHLNLVAEYNNVQTEAHGGAKAESSTYSAGAILFF